MGRVLTLPGGGLEFGESPDDAVVREVEEETGLIIRPQGLMLQATISAINLTSATTQVNARWQADLRSFK